VTRAEFDAACRRLPAVEMVVQWRASSVYKVGGKIFAVIAPDGSFSFKASDIAFEALSQSGRGRPAPHLARAKWVRFDAIEPLDAAEVMDWLTNAHDLVAANLTKKVRAELGFA
jgi:predicted DNA-binding protein (MmcQ/YjbR family)